MPTVLETESSFAQLYWSNDSTENKNS